MLANLLRRRPLFVFRYLYTSTTSTTTKNILPTDNNFTVLSMPTNNKSIDSTPDNIDARWLTARLTRLIHVGDLDAAKNLINLKLKSGYKLDLHTYTLLIDIHSRAKNFTKAFELLDEMESNGIRPTVVTYTTIAQRACRLPYYSAAQIGIKVIEHMKRLCVQPNERTIASLLRPLLEQSRFTNTRRTKSPSFGQTRRLIDSYVNILMNECNDLTALGGSIVIDILSHGRYTKLACQLLDHMRSLKLTPFIEVINRLLSKLVHEDNIDALINQYEKIKQFGPPPQIHTFVTLIRACALKQRTSEVEKYIEDMRSFGFSSSHFLYSALIGAYYKTNPHLSLKYFDRMKSEGISPSEIDLTNVALAYGCLGDSNSIDHVYSCLRVLCNGNPSIIARGAIIQAFNEAGRIDRIFSCLQSIEEDGLEPDIIILNQLLNTYARTKRHQEAINLFEKMFNSKTGVDQYSYSIMISMLRKTGDVVDAFRYFDRMKETGIQPNAHTYSAMCSALKEAKLFNQLSQLIAEMKANGFEPASIGF